MVNNSSTLLQRVLLAVGLPLLFSSVCCGQARDKEDYWLRFAHPTQDEYGYQDRDGKFTIPMGKYPICFTDTFRTYAVVLLSGTGFVAIDRQEKVLYEVFPFDNGPDNASDGLFRIVEKGKIGYADSATGKVVIPPQFDCAWPFENGVAKVSTDCREKSAGEHRSWLSDKWYYIDRQGAVVPGRRGKDD